MKNYFIYLLSFSFFLGLSCKNIDDFEPFGSNTFQYKKGNSNILKDINNSIVEFEIDPAKDNTLRFLDGSEIVISKNSLGVDNRLSTCNVVKVIVSKVQKKSEMIVNGIGTDAINGDVLLSGGMINIHAYCNSQELTLLNGKAYTLRLVYDGSKFKDEFEMFYAYNNSVDKPLFTWIEADGDSTIANNVNMSEWRSEAGKLILGLECFPKQLGWVNCDYFARFNNIDLVESCISFNSIPTGDIIHLNIYLVFKDLNIVLPANNIDNTNKKYCFKNIPKGKLATYVIVGKGKTNFYLGSKETKITNTDIDKLDLEVTSLENIKAFLELLK